MLIILDLIILIYNILKINYKFYLIKTLNLIL